MKELSYDYNTKENTLKDVESQEDVENYFLRFEAIKSLKK